MFAKSGGAQQGTPGGLVPRHVKWSRRTSRVLVTAFAALLLSARLSYANDAAIVVCVPSPSRTVVAAWNHLPEQTFSCAETLFEKLVAPLSCWPYAQALRDPEMGWNATEPYCVVVTTSTAGLAAYAHVFRVKDANSLVRKMQMITKNMPKSPGDPGPTACFEVFDKDYLLLSVSDDTLATAKRVILDCWPEVQRHCDNRDADVYFCTTAADAGELLPYADPFAIGIESEPRGIESDSQAVRLDGTAVLESNGVKVSAFVHVKPNDGLDRTVGAPAPKSARALLSGLFGMRPFCSASFVRVDDAFRCVRALARVISPTAHVTPIDQKDRMVLPDAPGREMGWKWSSMRGLEVAELSDVTATPRPSVGRMRRAIEEDPRLLSYLLPIAGGGILFAGRDGTQGKVGRTGELARFSMVYDETKSPIDGEPPCEVVVEDMGSTLRLSRGLAMGDVRFLNIAPRSVADSWLSMTVVGLLDDEYIGAALVDPSFFFGRCATCGARERRSVDYVRNTLMKGDDLYGGDSDMYYDVEPPIGIGIREQNGEGIPVDIVFGEDTVAWVCFFLSEEFGEGDVCEEPGGCYGPILHFYRKRLAIEAAEAERKVWALASKYFEDKQRSDVADSGPKAVARAAYDLSGATHGKLSGRRRVISRPRRWRGKF